jgi:hypothetical protein
MTNEMKSMTQEELIERLLVLEDELLVHGRYLHNHSLRLERLEAHEAGRDTSVDGGGGSLDEHVALSVREGSTRARVVDRTHAVAIHVARVAFRLDEHATHVRHPVPDYCDKCTRPW